MAIKHWINQRFPCASWLYNTGVSLVSTRWLSKLAADIHPAEKLLSVSFIFFSSYLTQSVVDLLVYCSENFTLLLICDFV